MIQLICHLLGDYVLQNQPMAQEKTGSTFWALLHATFYMIPFIVVGTIHHYTHHDELFAISVPAIIVMWFTHMIIDRYRLASWWVKFWGVGTFNSVVGGWIGYDSSPRAHEKDPEQRRAVRVGELVIYDGKWFQVTGPAGGTHEENKYYHLSHLGGPDSTLSNIEEGEIIRTRRRGVPTWLAVGLLIIVDNTMHLLINWACLTFLLET